jgi:uncharacterized membrane protein YfcA
MSAALMALLGLSMLGTAFLSGIFGMAGGMILIGILLAVLPLPQAMALHAVTQMASNGWRATLWWRHIRLRPAVAYMAGCVLAMLVWSLFRYVPSKPVAVLLLGLTPFAARYALPSTLKPNAEKLTHGLVYGSICMALVLLTGVSGPLVDTYFLGGKLERREIVATKSFCQVLTHLMKLIYFGGIIDNAASVEPAMMLIAIAASIAGTTAARRILEAMSDYQFRVWAMRIITSISSYYVLQGSYLLLAPVIWRSL